MILMQSRERYEAAKRRADDLVTAVSEATHRFLALRKITEEARAAVQSATHSGVLQTAQGSLTKAERQASTAETALRQLRELREKAEAARLDAEAELRRTEQREAALRNLLTRRRQALEAFKRPSWRENTGTQLLLTRRSSQGSEP